MSRTLIYAALARSPWSGFRGSRRSRGQARSGAHARCQDTGRRRFRRWNSPRPVAGTSSGRRRRRACHGRNSRCPTTARASITPRRPRACRSRARRWWSRAGCGPRRSSRRWTSTSPAPAPGTFPPTLPVERRRNAQPAAVEERRAEIWSTPQGFIKAALANEARVERKSGVSRVAVRRRRQVPLRRRAQCRGRGHARPHLDRQPGARRHVVGNANSATTRRSAPCVSRATSCAASVAIRCSISKVSEVRVDGVSVERGARESRARAAPDGQGDEARRRRVLSHGRHAPQRAHRAGRSPGDRRGAAERSAVARGHRQGEGDRARQADQVPGQHARAFRSFGRPAHVCGRGRDHRDRCRAIARSTSRRGRRRARSIPIALARSGKAARFETFTGKHVLAGRTPIEIHAIAGSGHNDAFSLVYLPAGKILVEADAYTPGRARRARAGAAESLHREPGRQSQATGTRGVRRSPRCMARAS